MTTETETPTLRHVPGGYVREDAYPSKAGPPMAVEFDREDDGRFIADVVDLPGVMAYGATREEAAANAFELAARVLREDAAQIAGNGQPDANEAPASTAAPQNAPAPNAEVAKRCGAKATCSWLAGELECVAVGPHSEHDNGLGLVWRDSYGPSGNELPPVLPPHPTPCAGCEHPEHPAEAEPPCGGSRCYFEDGQWRHTSKSYGSCAVNRGGRP